MNKYLKKLQKTGNVSLCLTLPVKLINYFNINSLFSLSLDANKREIIIQEYKGEKTSYIKKLNITKTNNSNIYKILIPKKILEQLSIKEYEYVVVSKRDDKIIVKKGELRNV
jgi:antitoxin component of MazEF toxin-antitoxin module